MSEDQNFRSGFLSTKTSTSYYIDGFQGKLNIPLPHRRCRISDEQLAVGERRTSQSWHERLGLEEEQEPADGYYLRTFWIELYILLQWT